MKINERKLLTKVLFFLKQKQKLSLEYTSQSYYLLFLKATGQQIGERKSDQLVWLGQCNLKSEGKNKTLRLHSYKICVCNNPSHGAAF